MLKIKWKSTDLYEPEGLNNFKTEIDEENHNWVQLIEKFCDILQVMGYYFDKDKVISSLEDILNISYIKKISEEGAEQSDWNWNWDREEDELDQLELFEDDDE